MRSIRIKLRKTFEEWLCLKLDKPGPMMYSRVLLRGATQQQLGIIRPSSLLFLRCVSKRGCAPHHSDPPKKHNPAPRSLSFCVVFFMPLSHFWVYFTKLNNVWKKNGTLIGNFSLALQKTAQIGPNAKKKSDDAPGGFTLHCYVQ